MKINKRDKDGRIASEISVSQRFHLYIKDEDHPNNCWIWGASLDNKGYGRFFYNGKTGLSHRFSYLLYKGNIPQGLCILHKCDTPACNNPDHLFLGTLKDNVQDMIQKGRANSPINANQQGEKHLSAKLTNDQVNQIRKLHNNGKTIIELSEIYKISRHHMGAICARRYWKHL